jgi:DNA-binding beta-propeller fold protein YncE
MRKPLCLLAIALAALSGCAGPETKPVDLGRFVWPAAPEKAKVRLLNVIGADVDLRETTASESLFGAEPVALFLKPHGIAVDGAGKTIYVTDTIRRAVLVLDPENGTYRSLGSPVKWTSPFGLALDEENGLLAVADGDRVYLISTASQSVVKTIGTKKDIERAVAAAFDPRRKLVYMADTKKSEISAYDYDGNRVSTIARYGIKEGEVYMPSSLAVDQAGDIYVLDAFNWRVQIFSPDGKLITTFGKQGDKHGDFSRPKGIAVTKDGLILVTDAAFNNFRIFDRAGNALLAVGEAGTGPGMLHVPEHIAVDRNDRIYVADQTNRRIQIFQLMTDAYYEKLERGEIKP